MSGFVGLFKPLLNHGESAIARGGRAAVAALREFLAVDERIVMVRSDAMRRSANEADRLDHEPESAERPTL
jgi:hypothetical protein